jgi:hypothetical protein
MAAVERIHGQQALAARFAARILDEAESLEGGARALVGAGEVAFAVVGVRQREIALRDAEAVTDAFEIAARDGQQLACAAR